MIKKINTIFESISKNGSITVDEAAGCISNSRVSALQVIRALLAKKALILKDGRLYLP